MHSPNVGASCIFKSTLVPPSPPSLVKTIMLAPIVFLEMFIILILGSMMIYDPNQTTTTTKNRENYFSIKPKHQQLTLKQLPKQPQPMQQDLPSNCSRHPFVG